MRAEPDSPQTVETTSRSSGVQHFLQPTPCLHKLLAAALLPQPTCCEKRWSSVSSVLKIFSKSLTPTSINLFPLASFSYKRRLTMASDASSRCSWQIAFSVHPSAEAI